MVKAILMIGLAGCTLAKQEKTACNDPSDCLDGYACENNVCVHDDGGSGGGSDASGFEYGDVQAFMPATGGVKAFNYDTFAGLTTAAGGLGCAMLADESAAPGTDIALAYAKIDKNQSGGDTRCPPGTFAIMNDPASCTLDPITGLHGGCAIYRRWDAAGTQVANRRAIGGYTMITSTYVSNMDQRCDVDISMRFAGGITIAKTFSFHYNPLGPAEAFCVPQ